MNIICNEKENNKEREIKSKMRQVMQIETIAYHQLNNAQPVPE